MHKYFAGFTSEHDCRNTMTPMRRHCDEIATFSAGGLNDCSVGMFMLEVRHSTRDPHDTRRIGNCFEDLCGVLPPCASCTEAPCPRSSAGRSSECGTETVKMVIFAPIFLARVC